MIRLFILITFLFLFSFAEEERVSSAALIKQKIEVKELKKELNILDDESIKFLCSHIVESSNFLSKTVLF